MAGLPCTLLEDKVVLLSHTDTQGTPLYCILELALGGLAEGGSKHLPRASDFPKTAESAEASAYAIIRLTSPPLWFPFSSVPY